MKAGWLPGECLGQSDGMQREAFGSPVLRFRLEVLGAAGERERECSGAREVGAGQVFTEGEAA